MEKTDQIEYIPRRNNDLTIKEVKAHFSQLTDSQAQAIIDSLKTFSLLLYEHYKNQEDFSSERENGLDIANTPGKKVISITPPFNRKAA